MSRKQQLIELLKEANMHADMLIEQLDIISRHLEAAHSNAHKKAA